MKNIFKKIIVFLLQLEAKIVLKKYRPKIVAITGSVGKTSIKDAVYSVMSTSFFVRKSSKSFNSEIGIPLTILGLPNAWNSPVGWMENFFDGLSLIIFPHKYPKWLVLEVGADRPGDIASVAFWLKPDISIVTRLSDAPVHVEFFNSAEQVRHEKSQLVHATPKIGTVILNADDKLVSSLRPLAKGTVVTYGTSNGADILGSDFDYVYSEETESGSNPFSFPAGISFNAHVAGHIIPIKIDGVLGRQQVSTALAALAVGQVLGIDMNKACAALRTHSAPQGRMNIMKGMNDTCVIDDTYNSSPVAAASALETLKNIHNGGGVGRKIAVLGDMLELGTFSLAEHEKLGKNAAAIADEIYAIGPRSKAIFDAALAAGFPKEHVFWFGDSVEAGRVLQQNIRSGDVVLVKGSQGIRMEKTVLQIMAEPKRASELLVRQEEEWKNR